MIYCKLNECPLDEIDCYTCDENIADEDEDIDCRFAVKTPETDDYDMDR